MRTKINIFFGKLVKQPHESMDFVHQKQVTNDSDTGTITPLEKTRQPQQNQFLIDCFGGTQIFDVSE